MKALLSETIGKICVRHTVALAI